MPNELINEYLEAKLSIEPIFIIKNEIMANPINSINEMMTKTTDIVMIKEVSFLDIMEWIDWINFSIGIFKLS